MPTNENQHYVPKCHLRPFSSSAARRNVALYNGTNDLFVASASIADQCQRSYFYGRDLKLEKWFQKLEGDYSVAVRAAVERQELPLEHETAIRAFMHYQYHRTPTAVAARQEFLRAMHEAATRGVPEDKHPDPGDLSDLTMLHDCIETASKSLEDMIDLRMVLVENRSAREFITSDHPSIMTNKLMLQRLKIPFGFASAGIIFALPLTPHLLALCYDNDVYSVSSDRSGRHVTNRVADIEAFNQLQFLQFQTNIYYRSAQQNNAVREGVIAASPRRVAGPAVWVGVEDKIEGQFTRYRKLEGDEPLDKPRLVGASPQFPQPSTWFRGLQIRAKPIGYGLPGRRIFVRTAHRVRNGTKLKRYVFAGNRLP